MNPNNCKKNHKYQPEKHKKRKLFFIFIFCSIILFLISFSATTFILMNSYRLTFAGNSLTALQQEIGLLKNEISRKNGEIEELKLQLANIEGESSFVNQNEAADEP